LVDGGDTGGVPRRRPTPASANTITDIVWRWTSVTIRRPRRRRRCLPESYTIIFKTDDTLTGKADCNSFSGTYSQENGFAIKLGPSTMAYCGETSLDQQYLQLLSSIAAGGPDGSGGLALETAGGEQRMLFKNGGAAPR
jgi:heat shock protein HslJ